MQFFTIKKDIEGGVEHIGVKKRLWCNWKNRTVILNSFEKWVYAQYNIEKLYLKIYYDQWWQKFISRQG